MKFSLTVIILFLLSVGVASATCKINPGFEEFNKQLTKGPKVKPADPVVGLKHITPQEAVGVLKSKSQRSQYLFIDTRPKPFYDACHVKNSISGEFKSKTKGGKLNKTIVEQYIKNGKTVVFYCNSYRCYRSLNAAIQAVCEWGFPADRIKWFGAGVAGIAQIYRRGVKGYNCEQFL